MTLPIALQLYTVREDLAHDFAGTLQKIAGMGYQGVETYPTGVTPQAARRLFDDLGLTVCGAHSPLPLGDQKNQVLDALAALDCRRLVCASQPSQLFQSLDGVQQVCSLLNEASENARAQGISVGYHNHWWEFHPLEGRPAHDILREHLAHEVFFEIDTYWVQTAGLDPVTLLRELGGRAPLLHIKDGPATQDAPMTAVGEGVMDFSAILAASPGSAEWLIVELDHCATDMLEAVDKSYQYLARGF
jgi:sugar phosphate isomerase/epimerase